MPYTSPEFLKSAFNCPYCDAYSNMIWCQHMYSSSRIDGKNVIQKLPMQLAHCTHCKNKSYWIEMPHAEAAAAATATGRMLVPSGAQAPMAHSETPDQIRVDYDEARNIVGESPRGAAALLRLAIQKLCIHLGEPGKNLNKDIGSLVKKGLPVEIQQALDIVRVIGNNSVHPGELSDEDVADIALTLFELINQIVEDRISRPNQLNALFEKLPTGVKKGITKRDGENS